MSSEPETLDDEAIEEVASSKITPAAVEELGEEKPAPDTIPAPADTYQPSPRRVAPQE